MDEAGRRELEQAYVEIGQDLWRTVYAYTGGARDVADEAVAEAFARAARSIHAIRDVKPWLYRVALRVAAREMGRRRATVPLEHAAERANPESEGVTELVDVLKRLSPKQRACFLLAAVFGHSAAETARMLGTSERAVRVHVHRARKRLRQQVEEVEET